MKFIKSFIGILSIILTLYSCKSSDLYDIKKYNEVLIVLYDATDIKKTKECDYTNSKNPKRPYCKYYFDFNLAKSIVLSYSEYEDFDKEYYEQPVLFFRVNKSFLKNNKEQIITLKKMQKMGYKKSFKLFKNSKHIFLIDESEIHNNKVTIKEVFLSYIPDSSAPILEISEQ